MSALLQVQKLPTKDDLIDGLMVEMDFFGMLRDRWQDEKEYEDFQDYLSAVKKKFPTCFHGKKHPFEFQFNVQGRVVTLRISSSKFKISSIRCISNEVAL